MSNRIFNSAPAHYQLIQTITQDRLSAEIARSYISFTHDHNTRINDTCTTLLHWHYSVKKPTHPRLHFAWYANAPSASNRLCALPQL